MRGGAGDDTYVVDNAGDTVEEGFNQGNDTILANVSYTLAEGLYVETLRANVATALTLTAFLVLAGATSLSADTPTPNPKALVGSWVTPPDSGADPIPSRQIFHDDGTTLLFIYATAECRVPAAAIEGTWTVHEGVLSTRITGTTDPRLIPIGQIQSVVIVALDEGRIVFDADDQLFVREKSETCYPPGSRRT